MEMLIVKICPLLPPHDQQRALFIYMCESWPMKVNLQIWMIVKCVQSYFQGLLELLSHSTCLRGVPFAAGGQISQLGHELLHLLTLTLQLLFVWASQSVGQPAALCHQATDGCLAWKQIYFTCTWFQKNVLLAITFGFMNVTKSTLIHWLFFFSLSSFTTSTVIGYSHFVFCYNTFNSDLCIHSLFSSWLICTIWVRHG